MTRIDPILTLLPRAYSVDSSRPGVPKLRMLRALAVLLALCCFAILSVSQSRAQNTINTVAGGANPNSTATLADIPGPTSAAVDASGNIYIASANSYYVFKVNPSTDALTVFAGIGIQGGGGDGGAASKAELIGPSALAVDSSGNVYIADGNKIREVTNDGNINTIAGRRTGCAISWDTCGDGGPAIDAQLNLPQALFVDNSGNLYIADTGDDRIRLVSGGNISTVAGTGHVCTGPHFTCGDGAAATLAQLDLPRGVVVDGSGNIYIGDTRDQRIRYVTKSSGIISTIVGSGSFCSHSTGSCGDGGPLLKAQLYNPAGVKLDGSGNLYIADSLDNKIRLVTFGSTPSISTIVGNGVRGFAGDQGPAKSAEMDVPLDLVLDSAGHLDIADSGNQRIRQVVSGTINTVAGGSLGGDGGAPLSATLANSIAVAWDHAGTNYYIADAANHRIRMVTPGSNSIISTVAGTGNMGYSGDGQSAVNATLNAPNGVAVNAAGDIFIADTGNQVVREVNAGTGVITTVAGNGNSCFPRTGVCGDGGKAVDATMDSPTSLAVDGDGNLYIADYSGCRVRAVNTSGIINTIAGTGNCNYSGDGGPGNKARVQFPYGIAADPAGNVYIADSKNNRIRCVIGATGGCGGSKDAIGTIITYAFNGNPTFKGDGGPALKAAMQDPLEVALDPAGNLFVGGGVDQVVRRIDALSQTVATVAGNPKDPTNGGFGGDGGPALQALLNNLGLAVNSAQKLLIADTGNNRIRAVNMVPVADRLTPSLNFGSVTVGQTSQPMNAKLKNTGLADLPITGVNITGKNAKDFAISSKSCVNQVAPDVVCSVGVTFTPKATGPRVATLAITDSLNTKYVKLTGTGQ
jgi:sugar lactone lactonase YvrE